MSERSWRRTLSALTRSDHEVAARRQAETSGRMGGTPVVSLPDRCRATVCGSLRSVSVLPGATTCTVEAELFDGSGIVLLRWIGRVGLAGVEPGRQVRVNGTITHRPDGTRVVYNPDYELLPMRP